VERYRLLRQADKGCGDEGIIEPNKLQLKHKDSNTVQPFHCDQQNDPAVHFARSCNQNLPTQNCFHSHYLNPSLNTNTVLLQHHQAPLQYSAPRMQPTVNPLFSRNFEHDFLPVPVIVGATNIPVHLIRKTGTLAVDSSPCASSQFIKNITNSLRSNSLLPENFESLPSLLGVERDSSQHAQSCRKRRNGVSKHSYRIPTFLNNLKIPVRQPRGPVSQFTRGHPDTKNEQSIDSSSDEDDVADDSNKTQALSEPTVWIGYNTFSANLSGSHEIQKSFHACLLKSQATEDELLHMNDWNRRDWYIPDAIANEFAKSSQETTSSRKSLMLHRLFLPMGSQEKDVKCEANSE
jgi:hypothetical protein